jgi:hypothetical protein
MRRSLGSTICEAEMMDDADAGPGRDNLWIRQVHDAVLRRVVAEGGGARDEATPPPEQLVVQLHNLVDQAVGLAWSTRSLARSRGWSLPAPVSALAHRLLRQVLDSVPPRDDYLGLLVLTDVPPGDSATGRLDASNHGERRRDVRLVWTPMVSDGGLQLGRELLRVDPVGFRLDPGDTRTVTVTLDVPASARPGVYTGVLSADDNPAVRLQMLVQVRPTNAGPGA